MTAKEVEQPPVTSISPSWSTLPTGDPMAVARRSPPPRPVALDVSTVVVWLGFGLTIGISLTAESRHQLASPGGVTMFLGNITGLAGTYLALVMVLLVSRIPMVERVLGQDGLLRWHRRLSPWPIALISAHAVLLTIGYAQAAHAGFWRQFRTFLSGYPDMITATIALGIMVAIGIVSIRAIRTRVRRERWWAFHLLMYLALALAFAHEIALGPSFAGHPLTVLVWSVAWAASAGLVLAYRFGMPIVRTLRHQLVVVDVRTEVPGVVSVILRGRHLDRLAVSGGQFFEWRFLARGMWWQAHPFSLSSRPRPPYLRLTVKDVGDFTSAVANLTPGTRVAIEGPYGAFTSYAATRPRSALIAGGIGITAVRSLLEDMPPDAEPQVVVRASTRGDVALLSEVQRMVDQANGRLHELVGSRSEVPFERLVAVIPDLPERDVFVAGSEGFVNGAVDFLRRLGLPEETIHFEIYAL